ncbi:hypothetical protein MUK60_07335 [Streptomyces sp. LRE541]|uniref:hypothetical protein n=1 Tax=Streptomyces sp. LRE541 TaxID=2931983 RepID=UPI00200BDC17|nr:hypothetical protein [Streptomyces sp. LRE541]UPZ27645.1 hypothetical protein MUK60_07335 [Streptomyces sp. LRE541]
MAMRLAASSTEYVRVTAASRAAGVSINVASPPKFAFLPASVSGNPEVADWLTGEWATPAARILIGPNGGTATLEAGEYSVWLTWAAGSENPVHRTSDPLIVY